MLSDQTVDILKAWFVAIADHELAIEQQRQYLARLEEFEPYATFNRLDRNNNGYLSAYEIFSFLKDNQFEASMEDCEYLVRFFDSDEDGVLNYTDYMQCVITCDDTYLRAAVTQRDPYGVNPDEYLSPILERELSILFQKELAYHREIQLLKRDLNDSPDFSAERAFSEIDDENLGFVDHTSIENFLSRNGFAPTEEELTAIIRRIDVTADANASFPEFAEALQPVYLDNQQPAEGLGDQREDNRWEYGSKGHPSRQITPKLANPSRVKIENLRAGYYAEFANEEMMDTEGYQSQQKGAYRSPGKKKYNAEEIPIARSYYERKR